MWEATRTCAWRVMVPALTPNRLARSLKQSVRRSAASSIPTLIGEDKAAPKRVQCLIHDDDTWVLEEG